MDKEDIKYYKEAGSIAKQVVDYAKTIIKPNMPLLEIAKKVESKIEELGGEPAFPVNLSIDHIAAHYHPTIDDETKATGLLKVDIGVHINGFIADTAFSIDLTENNEYITVGPKTLNEIVTYLKDRSLVYMSNKPT